MKSETKPLAACYLELNRLLAVERAAEAKAQKAFKTYKSMQRKHLKTMTSLLGSNPLDAELQTAAEACDTANDEYVTARNAANKAWDNLPKSSF